MICPGASFGRAIVAHGGRVGRRDFSQGIDDSVEELNVNVLGREIAQPHAGFDV